MNKKKTEYCRVIAFAQHKGGVGKTTTTVNVGAALAMKRYRVLLVDMDPQANMTESLGYAMGEHSGTVEALAGNEDIEMLTVEFSPDDRRLVEMDLLPSSLELAGSELQLVGAVGRELILKDFVKPLRRDYDFILIDCPPSLGLLTVNALAAADQVFIPIQAEYLAVKGLKSIINVINLIKKQINRPLKIGGGIITRYDGRKVLNREAANTIKKEFDIEIMNTRIRDNVALAEAPIEGKTIFEYAKNSNGAVDYEALATEIVHTK